MSSKRDLTGGTGDLNPQYMILYAQQTTANNYVIANFPIPINRFAQRRGKAMVMELLKVAYSANLATNLNVVGSQTCYWQSQISTKEQSSLDPSDGTVIDYVSDQITIYQPATPTAAVARWAQQPIVHDLTDGAGHGIIIATDRIYLWFNTVQFSNPVATWVRLYYRFKEVSLEEYVGMVQSQQS